MFDRAPKGALMVNAFEDIETTAHVQRIQGYFGEMAVGQGAIRLELEPALRQAGLDDAQIAERFPAIATLDRRWVPILNDMTPMIGVMSDNAAVAALPPFWLFPWFFVLPGLLVVATALVARTRTTGDARGTTEASDPIHHPTEGGA